jgi:hypothetical protein
MDAFRLLRAETAEVTGQLRSSAVRLARLTPVPTGLDAFFSSSFEIVRQKLGESLLTRRFPPNSLNDRNRRTFTNRLKAVKWQSPSWPRDIAQQFVETARELKIAGAQVFQFPLVVGDQVLEFEMFSALAYGHAIVSLDSIRVTQFPPTPSGFNSDVSADLADQLIANRDLVQILWTFITSIQLAETNNKWGTVMLLVGAFVENFAPLLETTDKSAPEIAILKKAFEPFVTSFPKFHLIDILFKVVEGLKAVHVPAWLPPEALQPIKDIARWLNTDFAP